MRCGQQLTVSAIAEPTAARKIAFYPVAQGRVPIGPFVIDAGGSVNYRGNISSAGAGTFAVECDKGVAQLEAVGLSGLVRRRYPGSPQHDMSQRTERFEMIFKIGEPGSGEFQSYWGQGDQWTSDD